MRVVDANVLLYAINADAPQHIASRSWLDSALGGADTVGLSWVALLAFVRLSTKSLVFPSPLTPAEATEQVRDWIATPGARILHPGERHAQILSELVNELGAGGNLVSDAHLVALAVEHRASIVSYDNDFTRFKRVQWHRPEELIAASG